MKSFAGKLAAHAGRWSDKLTVSVNPFSVSFTETLSRHATGQLAGKFRVSEIDDSLIIACQAGDPVAWSSLVRSLEQDVGKQMWRFSRDRQVCDELMQDVFVEVYRSLPRYKSMGLPLQHWVRRIATRVGYQYWKRLKRDAGNVPLEGLAKSLEQPEQVDSTEAATLLHKLLARLPAADRLILTLHYFEECSTQEIAERMGWNRAIVKMRAMRARMKLRKMIEAEGLVEQLEM